MQIPLKSWKRWVNMSFTVVTIVVEGRSPPTKDWFGIRMNNDATISELYDDFIKCFTEKTYKTTSP